MLWSVSIQAAGDRMVDHHEIVALADAVAASGGVASGIGQQAYGAQLVVDAEDRDDALALGEELFVRAAATAGLPAWSVSAISAVSEEDELP
jgi:hypothetical protein